ncbi:MAG: GDYXXLXY domain-containing protein [Rhodobiaceae bacterium]|nr:GDYXXLXY domain-containing protein [Rhodobiaceae bacterium]
MQRRSVCWPSTPTIWDPNETAIRATVNRIERDIPGQDCTRCPSIFLSYPLDSYFVPEGTGTEIEEYRNERALGVIVALNEEGDAAIKGLMMDGEKIYDTPLF